MLYETRLRDTFRKINSVRLALSLVALLPGDMAELVQQEGERDKQNGDSSKQGASAVDSEIYEQAV